MAVINDRVGELVDGIKRKRKIIVSPEGVPLDIQIASRGERLTALILDLVFMYATIVCLYFLIVLVIFADVNIYIGFSIISFAAFVVRNVYFIHFELAWQGRTPGKKICGIRVINRQGGELTPQTVVARNLTREVEVFMPITMLFAAGLIISSMEYILIFGWVIGILCIPLFTRDCLRAGDLIAGTMVIAMPKRALLGDLTTVKAAKETDAHYTFTHVQLAIYGTFELQVLEEFLRRPPLPENQRLLEEVCVKICNKINWPDPVPREEVRRFLYDFYTAERANLERGQLFGKVKADKNTPLSSPNQL